MKLLKITFTGNQRYVRSIPGTGETKVSHEAVENKEAIVLIERDTPFYIEAALVQFDHSQKYHDAHYERNGYEIIGSLHAIYRAPVQMFSKI